MFGNNSVPLFGWILEFKTLKTMLIALYQGKIRAGRVPGGTIVLLGEQTERSRTIPSVGKKLMLRTRS